MKSLSDLCAHVISSLLVKLVYNLKTDNHSRIPETGGALLIANRKSYLDFLFIRACTKRRVHFVINRPQHHNAFLRFLHGTIKMTTVSVEDSEEHTQKTIRNLRTIIEDGDVVCLFFDVAHMFRRAQFPFVHVYNGITTNLEAPVIPIGIDQMWGGLFFYDRHGAFHRFLKSFPYSVRVICGEPLSAHTPSYIIRMQVQELVAQLACEREEEVHTLHLSFMHEAKRHPFRLCMSDTAKIRANYIHALSGMFMVRNALFPKRSHATERIGIMLPDGCQSIVAIYAALFAGHTVVPIALPITRERLMAFINENRMKYVITTSALCKKFEIPSHEAIVHLDHVLQRHGYLTRWLFAIITLLLPKGVLSHLFITKRPRGIHETAAILYSSGTTGKPKGVCLSHANILSNVEALYHALKIYHHDRICVTVPFAQPFGFTTSVFFPLLSGARSLFIIDPHDVEVAARRIRRFAPTILLSKTSTLSLFARKLDTDDMKTLDCALVGIEMINPHAEELFYRKFGVRPFESYGAVELSPLVTVGVPGYVSEGERMGNKPLYAFNVGHPLPGIAVKVIHPESGEIQPYHKKGILYIKGPNVMQGYFDEDEATTKVMQDGWFKTSDIAYLDEDGVIHIIDRITRFTKIGHRYASHKDIEQLIHNTLDTDEERCVATSVTDHDGRERIVILFTPETPIHKVWEKIQYEKVITEGHITFEDFYEIPAIPTLSNERRNYVRIKERARDLDYIHRSSRNFSEVTIESSDGIQICMNHYKRGHDTIVIMAHGWRNAKDTYSFLLLSGMFSKQYDVICFDFRGHGKSGGTFSWTSNDNLDLKATIAYAKRNGYKKVAVVGFSLGAAIAIIEGAENRDIDTVIAVSGPYDFWKIDYHFWEEDIAHDMKIIFGHKGIGRTIRPGNPFSEKVRPIDVVENVSPTPLMILHGDADWLIKPYHAEALIAAAAEPKKLVMLPGEGHADRIFDHNPELFEKVCFEWLEETLH